MRLFFAAAVLALPTALHTEPMSLDDALRLAETRAPELQAREAGLDAAQSAAIAADRLPDPKLNIVLQDFPVTGPDAGRLNRDDFTMQVIGISQDFPNPAKRRARATRAQADIGIARADEAVTAQDVRLATALAWVDLFYAKKRLKELEMLDAGLGDLQATVTARRRRSNPNSFARRSAIAAARSPPKSPGQGRSLRDSRAIRPPTRRATRRRRW